MSGQRGVDIGHGHHLMIVGWHPNRALNPQYDGRPDIEKAAFTIFHAAPDGTPCRSGGHFDTPEVSASLPGLQAEQKWTVESWEPLTLSPSLLCSCGDHGHIREGKWVPA